jgi:CRP-like cAMP-binding protein
MVQVPGWARFMPVAVFPELMQSCPTLRFKLHRFAFALHALAARSSACNRRHRTDQRMARWLLLTQDRSDSTTLPLTHQFIALMLGVRRSTVTNTAEELRTAGLIRYSRGRIQIVDRAGLERRSCECYQVVNDVYAAALSADDDPMFAARKVS